MTSYRQSCILITCILLTATQIACAATTSSIQFFASNNKNEITLQDAYQRLGGTPQHDLQKNIAAIMQKNQIKKAGTADILGVYHLSSDQNTTADNSEDFTVAPNQSITDQKAFSIAQQLAISLDQESVAVIIPNQSTLCDVTVIFDAHQPKIDNLVKRIHDKLPANYSNAYSLYLTSTKVSYPQTEVKKIEWIGSKLNLDDIKKAFPHEKITTKQGAGYLVYQNGQKQPL